MKNTRLFLIVGSALSLLFIPFIAMQFTDAVEWSATDFIIMGVMLVIAGLICELILRKVQATKHRVMLCLVLLVLFLLIWAELAVGIFGTPFAGS